MEWNCSICENRNIFYTRCVLRNYDEVEFQHYCLECFLEYGGTEVMIDFLEAQSE